MQVCTEIIQNPWVSPIEQFNYISYVTYIIIF